MTDCCLRLPPGRDPPAVRCSVLIEQQTYGIVEAVDIEAVVVDAFRQLGVRDLKPGNDPDSRADLVFMTADEAVVVEVKYRSLVTDDAARRLLDQNRGTEDALLVVGDRVTESARKLLTSDQAISSRGGGYLDLRGRLAFRTEHMIIDAPVEPLDDDLDGRRARRDPLSGKAGLEVATAILMQPHRGLPVRELARFLGRSPSTVSDILSALRLDSVLDASNKLTGTGLFWEVADRWATSTTYLGIAPDPSDPIVSGPLRLGAIDPDTADAVDREGWALTGTSAAAAYGAPVAIRSSQPLDFYLPDAAIHRRARTLLGATTSASDAAACIRVAPVPAVVRQRVDPIISTSPWPLAHPLFVALDLAQDIGRGREILADWTPPDRWTRVW